MDVQNYEDGIHLVGDRVILKYFYRYFHVDVSILFENNGWPEME